VEGVSPLLGSVGGEWRLSAQKRQGDGGRLNLLRRRSSCDGGKIGSRRLGSRPEQRRHHPVAGQGKISDAGAEGVGDGVADRRYGRAAGSFADPERRIVGNRATSSTSICGTSLKRKTG